MAFPSSLDAPYNVVTGGTALAADVNQYNAPVVNIETQVGVTSAAPATTGSDNARIKGLQMHLWGGSAVYGGTVATAGTVTLPGTAAFFTLSGTTTVDDIALPTDVRTVYLHAGSSFRLTNGQHLHLGEDMVLAADQVLPLFCDGTAWYAAAAAVNFGTPAFTLGTANSAGTATTLARTDATLAAFDTTVPVTQALGDAAATGTAAVAARRDHRHGMPTTAPLVVYDEGTLAGTVTAGWNFVGADLRGTVTGGTAVITSSPFRVAQDGALLAQQGTVNFGTPLVATNNSGAGRTDVAIATFIGSGPTAARGAVPAPGTAAGTILFLREDGIWGDPTATGGGMANPMTTAGDMILGGAGGAPTRLIGGTANANKVLTVNSGGTPTWTAPTTGGLVRIEEQILGAASGTINFTNIPQTYRNLEFTIVGRCSASAMQAIQCELNGDTGGNYDIQNVYGSGAGAAASGGAAGTAIQVGWLAGTATTANVPGAARMTIYDYARTSWDKIIDGYSWSRDAGARYAGRQGGVWLSTAAVGTINLFIGAGVNFASATVVTLWGQG